MTIAYSHTPSFVFAAMLRAHPAWAELPVALIDDDGCIWACSASARDSGVLTGMTPRQARARCPDLQFHPLDTALIDEIQARFLGVLTGTGLTVECAGYGQAYCDLSPISRSPADALPVCADLGKQLRKAVGDDLTPAIGCDHGKFTARAAASVARPGRLRVVDAPEEQAFLAPLPVTLLPLPLEALRELVWLGVTTLDAFAKLPATGVLQRWGKPGAAARQLAQGCDPRPVLSTQTALPAPVTADFETPCESADQALPDLARAVAPVVQALAERLCGCQNLTLTLTFLDRQTRAHDLAFAIPLFEPADVAAALSRALRSSEWPAPLLVAGVAVTSVSELPSGQLTLFDDVFDLADVDASPLGDIRYTDTIAHVGRRYPDVFYSAALSAPTHRVPERRVRWTRAGSSQ